MSADVQFFFLFFFLFNRAQRLRDVHVHSQTVYTGLLRAELGTPPARHRDLHPPAMTADKRLLRCVLRMMDATPEPPRRAATGRMQ